MITFSGISFGICKVNSLKVFIIKKREISFSCTIKGKYLYLKCLNVFVTIKKISFSDFG